MPNKTNAKIDTEKFASFKMPMIGDKPISDFENFQQFVDYALEQGMEPKTAIHRIFNKYAAFNINNYNNKYFSDFRMDFNQKHAFIGMKKMTDGYFYLLKEVTEDARAKYSFSDEAYEEYKKNKGAGYYADYISGKIKPADITHPSINKEKFDAFDMPKIYDKPISDFKTFADFSKYADECGVEPKAALREIYRSYTHSHIIDTNQKCSKYFEDFRYEFETKHAAVMRSRYNVEGSFILLKEISEKARAKYSFSDERYVEYMKEIGDGATVAFLKSKMPMVRPVVKVDNIKVEERPVVKVDNLKVEERPVVKAYNLEKPDVQQVEVKPEVEPVEVKPEVQPIVADKSEALFGDDESELDDVAEPAVEPVNATRQFTVSALKAKYLDIFNQMLAETKNGDSIFRGSSNEYKSIQAALRSQIKELNDSEAPDFASMKKNVNSILDMAVKYVEKRAEHLSENGYKGRRVNIINGIANKMLDDEMIKLVTQEVEPGKGVDEKAVEAKPVEVKVDEIVINNPVEKADALQKASKNSGEIIIDKPAEKVFAVEKPVENIFTLDEVMNKPVVKAFTIEKDPFESAMGKAIVAMRARMKKQGLYKRHPEMREDIYFHFPMPSAVEHSIQDRWTRTEEFFKNFDKIEKYMRDHGCNKIVNTFKKAFEGMDKDEMMKSGKYADTIAKGVKVMRECVSGMTDKEYEIQLCKSAYQMGIRF